MARRGKLPIESFEAVQDIATRAASGDNAAAKELGWISNKLARLANDRLRSLEQKGYVKEPAYNYAQKIQRRGGSEGGKVRFSEAKRASEEQLLKNAADAWKFLNYKSSTISGVKKQLEGVVEGLKQQGYDVGNKETFKSFLMSPAWSEMKRIYGTTNTKQGVTSGAMTVVTNAISRGASLRELMNAYNTREQRSESAFAAIDNWVQVNMEPAT